MRRGVAIALFLTILLLLATHAYNIASTATKLHEQSLQIAELRTQSADLHNLNADLHYLITKDLWEAIEVELTAYAPLDSRAVEGMCFSGDPTVTASGSRSTPGRTVAAGRGFAYGTKIYIPGHGHRIVEDRGGAISDTHIDLMVDTKEEAYAIGREKVIIFVKLEDVSSETTLN